MDEEAEILEQTFTFPLLDGTEVELKPNGGNILLCEANKEEYLSLLIEYKYQISVAPFVDAMASGMKDVLTPVKMAQLSRLIPTDLFSIILSGDTQIDIEKLIEFVIYPAFLYQILFSFFSDSYVLRSCRILYPYSKEDKTVKQLFSILRSFSEVEKRLFASKPCLFNW